MLILLFIFAAVSVGADPILNEGSITRRTRCAWFISILGVEILLIFNFGSFSIGVHVVGQAGREILLRTGKPVARITGLDAERTQWGKSSCLAKTDATYVEVIHTNGDGLLSSGIGVAFGDVDFFVNGGRKQPGCHFHDCSHKRAYELFAGTFARTEKLYGNYCPSMMHLDLNKCGSPQLHVGDDTLAKSRVDGIYRVNTGSTYPY